MLKVFFRFISALIIPAFFLSGCISASPPAAVTAGQRDIRKICDRYQIDWHWDTVSQVITLRKGGQEARALVGSNLVVVGSQKIALDAPVKRENNTIVVPYDFTRKVVWRFSQSPAQRKKSSKTRAYKVIIDAGHGGKDPGASGHSGTKEKMVVLGISQKLKKELSRRGIEVVMTRKKDVFLTLEERTEIASRTDSDIFISIHANASPARKASGIEIYTYRGREAQDMDEQQWEKNHQLAFQQYQMDKSNSELRHVIADMLYQHKLTESSILADKLIKGMTREVRARNRGAKESGVFVVRNTLIPAVLIEVGFLSNPREERLLKSDDYQKQIAKAIAEGVDHYFGL